MSATRIMDLKDEELEGALRRLGSWRSVLPQVLSTGLGGEKVSKEISRRRALRREWAETPLEDMSLEGIRQQIEKLIWYLSRKFAGYAAVQRKAELIAELFRRGMTQCSACSVLRRDDGEPFCLSCRIHPNWVSSGWDGS